MDLTKLGKYALVYFFGLILSIVTMFALASMKYISVVETSTQGELFTLLISAFAVWTVLFIVEIANSAFLDMGAFGILFAFGYGYLAMSVANYANHFFKFGMLSYEKTDGSQFATGLLIVAIMIASSRLAKSFLKKETSSNEDEE